MDSAKRKLSSVAANDITSQMIIFKDDDKKYCFETNQMNVTVIGSTGNQRNGSSKVKLKNIVDYKWEAKRYPGHLIAVHIDGKHIAYAIRVNNKENEGMVRVVNAALSLRALIKGMTGEVLDLQFAHLKSKIILGCIEKGALHIHKIENMSDSIVCTLLLKIQDSMNAPLTSFNRINWCPYVPEDEMEIDEYVSHQLVWIRGSTYQCYSIRSVIDMYGNGSHLDANEIEGTLKHKESTNITGATFSPDGTTLGVSCEDGVIRFYQVYFLTNETNPRCLHNWIPHGGKPINSFFFLDNHTRHSTERSLWRHAITTADNNTEIKVWCCSTWECTQTIHFKSVIEVNDLFFTAEIDRTSSYLVLSDIKNRGLYVLEIYSDSESSGKNQSKVLQTNRANENTKDISDQTDEDQQLADSSNASPSTTQCNSTAYIKSISEFPLSSPILSFGIVDAAVRKYKCAFNDSYLIEELDDYDEENHLLYCVVIHMFLVQPKSVQECHVLYQPTVSLATDVANTIAGSKTNNVLESINSSMQSEKIDIVEVQPQHKLDDKKQLTPKLSLDNLMTSPKLIKIDNNVIHPALVLPIPPVIPKQAAPINLMTPDSFNSKASPVPEGVSNEVLTTLRMLAQVQSPPDAKRKSADNMNLLNLVNNKAIEDQEQRKILQSVELNNQILASTLPSGVLLAGAASGGSSPSREVQEILSPKDSDCLNEFYDDPSDILDENDAESLENKKITEDSYNFNETCSKDENERIKIASLTNKNDWPKVPDVPSLSNLHCANFNNITNSSNTTFIEIGYKLDQILEFIQTQSCQISELRSVVHFVEAQKNKNEDTIKLGKLSEDIEFNLSKMIEGCLSRYEREHNKRLENFMATREAQNREFRDSIVHSVAQLVCNQITDRFSTILVNEFQRHIMPLIGSKLDAIKTQIQSDVAQKITACDQLLRDNIAKMCSNKSIMETFANAILLGVQTSFQKIYTESMKTILIPAYEKSSQEMFKQIQEVFMEGTKAYSKEFESYIVQYEPIQDELIGLLQSIPEQLKLASDTTISGCTAQLNGEIQKDLKAMQVNLVKTIRDNVKNEIQKGFESQAAAIEDSVLSVVRSQAQTPAPSVFDVQEQIKSLLGQGQINSAFHQALVANDLNLVEFTLEKADYKTVFYPCPLQQTVLLSLIQQISADMSNHNELKQKYLADAILNLNLLDPTTKEHAPKVMRELFQHCQNYAAANPNSANVSGVRMLMMAVQGLGIKLF